MKELGISYDEQMKFFIEVPKMMSVNLPQRTEEILFLFKLYLQFDTEDVMKIYRSFPYLFCTQPYKIKGFMQEFRKYRFTKEQIMRLCCESGGLLGTSHKNFRSMMHFCKHKGVRAKRIIDIMDDLPAFAIQNRQNLI